MHYHEQKTDYHQIQEYHEKLLELDGNLVVTYPGNDTNLVFNPKKGPN